MIQHNFINFDRRIFSWAVCGVATLTLRTSAALRRVRWCVCVRVRVHVCVCVSTVGTGNSQSETRFSFRKSSTCSRSLDSVTGELPEVPESYRSYQSGTGLFTRRVEALNNGDPAV